MNRDGEMRPFALGECGNSIVISNFEYDRAADTGGNPYNTAFWIEVASEGFRGCGPCECDIRKFVAFARQINELYEFRRSKVELLDICYGSRVFFEMDRTGHVAIGGEIFGRSATQRVQFEFLADQTSLRPFASALRQVYELKR